MADQGSRHSAARADEAYPRAGARIDRYERGARIVLGAALMLFGARRRRWYGWVFGGSGALIAYRGVKGRRAVGRRLAIPRALDFHRSVVLSSPPDVVYRYLRELTHWSRFMEQVESTRATGDGTYRSRVCLGALRYDLDLEVTDESAPGHFEWRALPDAELFHRGEVDIVPGATGRGTVVTVRIQLLPPGGAAMTPFFGMLQRAAAAQLTRALERLREVVDTPPAPAPVRSVQDSPGR